MNKISNEVNKIVIGLDLDGVIIDSSQIKLAVAKELGWNLTIRDTPAEIIKNKLPADILSQLRDRIYSNLDMALKSSLIPGVQEGLKKIEKQGFKYYLVSRRKEPEIAVKFLEKNRLWPIYFNNKNSFFVKESIDKEKKSKELGVNIFLDDELDVLTRLISVKNKFLFDPFDIYSQSALFNLAIKKIKNWEEFLRVLDIKLGN